MSVLGFLQPFYIYPVCPVYRLLTSRRAQQGTASINHANDLMASISRFIGLVKMFIEQTLR